MYAASWAGTKEVQVGTIALPLGAKQHGDNTGPIYGRKLNMENQFQNLLSYFCTKISINITLQIGKTSLYGFKTTVSPLITKLLPGSSSRIFLSLSTSPFLLTCSSLERSGPRKTLPYLSQSLSSFARYKSC